MRTTRTALMSGAALVCAAAVAVSGASMASAHDSGGSRGGLSTSSERGVKGAPFADLVTKGTITQAQADAIKAALDAQRTADQAAHDKAEAAALAGLVTKGTITQAQADAITKADRRGMRALVADGTITQAQAQAVHTAMEAAHSDKDRTAKLDSVLAGLVTKGTITQAQADAIKASAPAQGARSMGAGKGERGGHGRGGHHGMRGGSPSPTSSPTASSSTTSS